MRRGGRPLSRCLRRKEERHTNGQRASLLLGVFSSENSFPHAQMSRWPSGHRSRGASARVACQARPSAAAAARIRLHCPATPTPATGGLTLRRPRRPGREDAHDLSLETIPHARFHRPCTRPRIVNFPPTALRDRRAFFVSDFVHSFFPRLPTIAPTESSNRRKRDRAR